MSMKTHDLVSLRNTGHSGINSLFSKAHSMDWDIDRDVDWDVEIREGDPCIATSWAPFGRTATYQALPKEAQDHATREALIRTLGVLQVGESVAQDVCAKLALLCEEEDYRNHAVAQAMDEARHHVAYVRFLEKMGAELRPPDAFTTQLFDDLLASDDVTNLIATEQFFLESFAMRLFENMAAQATHPLLRDIVTLIKRDESRHMGFGVLYVTDHLRSLDPEARLAFASKWMPRIVGMLEQRPGPHMVARIAQRISDVGVSDAEGLAQRMFEEQQKIEAADREEATSGRRVPHLLSSCRRAGLLTDELLEPLGLREHPYIQGALRAPAEAA